MGATYYQRGEAIDYANAGSTDIAAGDIVVIGERIGIAGTDIPAGGVGSLMVEGVYLIPKDTAAIGIGATVYYAGGKATATSGSVTAGYAIEAAAADDVTVKVKLLG